jgi:hypothetical protein
LARKGRSIVSSHRKEMNKAYFFVIFEPKKRAFSGMELVCSSSTFSVVERAFLSPCFVDLVLFPTTLLFAVLCCAWVYVFSRVGHSPPSGPFFMSGLVTLVLFLVEAVFAALTRTLPRISSLVRLGSASIVMALVLACCAAR